MRLLPDVSDLNIAWPQLQGNSIPTIEKKLENEIGHANQPRSVDPIEK